MIYTTVDSPVGSLLLTRSPAGLSGLYLEGQRNRPVPSPSWREDRGAFADVESQLEAYFAGQRRDFDLPLDLDHGTAFQQRVWRALLAIPHGAHPGPHASGSASVRSATASASSSETARDGRDDSSAR